MAEGWAREWVQQQQKSRLESSSPSSSSSSANSDLEFLNSIVVASVALDSDSVFKGAQEDGTVPSRISVKGKAIQAMAVDGVDISSFTPKTLNELVTTLSRGTSDPREDGWSTIEMNTTDKALDGRPLDRLVVMYSCADNVKHHVAQHSRSVTQWSIEAPTAAAKAGEGDEAYRRVSLEIRAQVETLLDELMQQHGVMSAAATAPTDSSSILQTESTASEVLT